MSYPQPQKRKIETVQNDRSESQFDGKRNGSQSLPRSEARRFACPFSKRYPDRKPINRTCTKTAFPTIHRLKEHLIRHHNPIFCNRCHSTFKHSSALEEHQRVEEPCRLQRDSKADLWLDATAIEYLKLRSKRQEDEAEKWQKIYRFLFSGTSADCTPSPCEYPRNPSYPSVLLTLLGVDHAVSQTNTTSSVDRRHLEVCAQDDLSCEFRANLETAIREQLTSIDSDTVSRLADIVKSVAISLVQKCEMTETIKAAESPQRRPKLVPFGSCQPSNPSATLLSPETFNVQPEGTESIYVNAYDPMLIGNGWPETGVLEGGTGNLGTTMGSRSDTIKSWECGGQSGVLEPEAFERDGYCFIEDFIENNTGAFPLLMKIKDDDYIDLGNC